MNTTLCDTFPPRRKSAAQASRAFAEQLDSSDDDSQRSGSEGVSKKTKKKVLKKDNGRSGKLQTYGKRGRLPKVVDLASSKSTPKRLGLVSLEGESDLRTPKPQPKSTVKTKKSPSVSILSSPIKPAGSSLPLGAGESSNQRDTNGEATPFQCTPPSSGPARKKTKISHESSSQNGFSDLTSLSHSVEPGDSDSEIEILPFNPVLLPVVQSPATPVATNHGSGHHEDPTWRKESLGSYVWVLIEPISGRVCEPDKDERRAEYRLWWPGKIMSSLPTEIPLRVKLFGQKNVVIHEPLESNIVSKLDTLGRWRYQSPVFMSTPIKQTPTKTKQGNDYDDTKRISSEEIKGKWKDAVIEMKQTEEAEQDSDYLPDVGEISSWPMSSLSLSQSSNKDKVKKGKRKRDVFDDALEDDSWEPPPPDETLQIPGELVLAREAPGRGASAIHNMVHWPAKVLAYRVPKRPKDQPKYLVKWLDGTEGEIPRSAFYTVDEEGFAICKLGTFESSVADADNDDEGEDIEAFKARWNFSRRSLSPEATDPPPSMETFKQLDIRARFAFTKPVLRAILNKGYEPLVELHGLFMAGGPKRSRLLEYSARRGNIDPEEVGELTNYLKEWCLRPPITNISHTSNQENDTEFEKGEEKPRDLSEILKSNIGSFSDLGEGEGRAFSPPITVLPSSPGSTPPSSSFPVEREKSRSPETTPTTTKIHLYIEHSNIPSDVPADNPETIKNRKRPPRPRGCDEYEVMTELDKLNYCTSILLPESIRQILLWQAGVRTSVKLLSAEAEKELFEKGEMLLNETEWVFNVKTMRQKAEKVLKRNGTGKRRAQPVDYRE